MSTRPPDAGGTSPADEPSGLLAGFVSRRLLVTVLVVAAALLAGCSTLDDLDVNDDGPAHEGFEDPATDQIGWEEGVWYDESIGVTFDDGLNESERELVMARTKARVETIRELEFDGNVSLSVISRDEYRSRQGGGGGGPAQSPWNEQVWEALLLIGEDETVGGSFGSTLNGSVQGYYSPTNDSIVLVSDAAAPTLDRNTLSHELVHALQDQHANVSSQPTQDRQLAQRGLTEGEASLVQRRYDARCRGQWECLPLPQSTGSGGGSSSNPVFLVLYQPYATGPDFVEDVIDRGGWERINDMYDDPPASTEQVIHPDRYPDEEPVDVTVEDRSNERWQRFDHDPVADTVGEASIFAMLQAHNEANRQGRSVYEYTAVASDGWAGDTLVPYHPGNTSAEGGYVWRTAWDSEEDAEQFYEAYTSILSERAESRPRSWTFRLPESDRFGDAFHVQRDGDTVTIVNGPSMDALEGIHAPAGPA